MCRVSVCWFGAAGTFWTPAAGGLTRQGFAGVGVPLQGLVAVHAQALVGAVGVDAALAAREDGGALVHVHARLPVVLQEEAWPAFALREQQRATSADESSLESQIRKIKRQI